MDAFTDALSKTSLTLEYVIDLLEVKTLGLDRRSRPLG